MLGRFQARLRLPFLVRFSPNAFVQVQNQSVIRVLVGAIDGLCDKLHQSGIGSGISEAL